MTSLAPIQVDSEERSPGNKLGPLLLSSTYLGPLDWWALVVHYPEVYIEAWESFPKQSFRNRCYIDSPQGSLALSVPMSHKGPRYTGTIQVSYQKDWPSEHLQALRTSYHKSPFYEELFPALEEILRQHPPTLWELNRRLMAQLGHWLQLPGPLPKATNRWEAQWPKNLDYRESLHPKHPSPLTTVPSYPQMFSHKHDFLPRLSILDLLFNEGPAAYDYLRQLVFVNSSPL